MIKSWNIKHSLIAGVLLILLSNTVALSGVYYNRSGEPESTVTLTERELRAPYIRRFNKENSGMALRLVWKTVRPTSEEHQYYYGGRSPEWLNEKKLTELGFDIESEKQKRQERRSFRRILPQEVFLVMEYDGESFNTDVKHAEIDLRDKQSLVSRNPDRAEFVRKLENAKRKLQQLKQSGTRLYIIDASIDRETLREKYPDRSKYIVVQGQVRMWLRHRKKRNETTVTGYISGLNVGRINISKKHRPNIDRLLADRKYRVNDIQIPRYAVKVSWGQRLEPWVREVVVLEQ